jgi:hypothetical protein
VPPGNRDVRGLNERQLRGVVAVKSVGTLTNTT